MTYNLATLAARLGGRASGDEWLELTGVADLGNAGPCDIAFVESTSRLDDARRSSAGCLLVPSRSAISDRNTIEVVNPKLAFALVAAEFHPERRPLPGFHSLAVIDPSASIGRDVHLAAGVVVGANCVIGDGVVVGAGTVIGDGVTIATGSTLFPRVVVYPGTHIGKRARIHAGAVLGCDGFGYVRGEDALVKFPQVGRLVIGNDVEIGANTTIDRGALGDTTIGDGAKIDNLVQIAHNVAIGQRTAISAQTGIAGSSRIGDDVTMGGQVGLGDHVMIANRVTIGAQAGVASGKRVRGGQVLWGTPARPIATVKRQIAEVALLGELRQQLRELRERLDRLSAVGEPPTDE